MKLLHKQLAIAALAFAALAPRPAAAQVERAALDKTLSPYFFIENGDPMLDRLPLKQTHVGVEISGVIADVIVRQVYENRGRRPIHAQYVFPASTRAAVYGMTMTVGDVRIVAKIKGREKAKAEFESAKREGKSASLLEQSRPNVFTMNAANETPAVSPARRPSRCPGDGLRAQGGWKGNTFDRSHPAGSSDQWRTQHHRV